MNSNNDKIFYDGVWSESSSEYWRNLDLSQIPTPVYVVSENYLEQNLKILDEVQKRTDAKIIMALKGFSLWKLFPLISQYLHGVDAASLNEARLGKEEFKKEVSVFAPAYKDEEFNELLKISDRITFNSLSQWHKFKNFITDKPSKVEFGLRVNPEKSEVDAGVYDPCSPSSRLGIKRSDLKAEDLEGISGLHFHCLCESDAKALERVLVTFEEKFGEFLPLRKWVNFGGGHHISRPGYDVDLLCRIIKGFKKRYSNLDVYLEPGEAISLNAGVLVSTVTDIVSNEMDIAMLDTSMTHMPDVKLMPYRPAIIGGDWPQKKQYTYRLGGLTCLAGDIIGDYSFDKKLKIGDKLVFLNMAHYTMVEIINLCGIQQPSIMIQKKNGEIELVKKFEYEDYKSRLS